MKHPVRLSLLALLAACGGTTDQQEQKGAEAGTSQVSSEPADPLTGERGQKRATTTPPEPLNPPAPGQPGGLPDDRTPISEAPFDKRSAQGAADVVQTYYALLEAKQYPKALRLWGDHPDTGSDGLRSFVRSFEGYAEYHANVGAPGRIEGAAGSLYVEVPVQVYGRLKSGEEFNRLGSVQLRRSNGVPGSTPEQQEWQIAAISLNQK